MQIPFHHSSLKNFYELIKNDDLFKELIETNQKLNAPLLNYIYTHLLPDAVLQYRLGARDKCHRILRSFYYPTYGGFNKSITRMIGLNNFGEYKPSSYHPLKQKGYYKSDWKVSSLSVNHLTSTFNKVPYKNHSDRRKLIEHDKDMLSWPITNEILNNKHLKDFIYSYYGFSPLVVGVRSWCTRRVRKEEEVYQDAMSWHIDLDFNNHIKAFVFTTDVDQDLGDHQYVDQTHDNFLPKMLYHGGFNRYTSKQLAENNLNYRNLSPSRGQLVIANTRCLHRGTPVSSNRERLIFEITFADSPVGQMRMPLDMFLSINKLK